MILEFLVFALLPVFPKKMTTVADKIIATLNVMRDIVLKEKEFTVRKLRELLVYHKGDGGDAVLDAVLESPFQKNKLHYILALIRRDIWRHRGAIEGTRLNTQKLVDENIIQFWSLCLTKEQQTGLVKCACQLIDLVKPIAEGEQWDETPLAEWIENKNK